jgi:hypothetical protein
MFNIESLGHTWATIIRVIWYLCGISFAIYCYRRDKKIDIGSLLIIILGPVGWLCMLQLLALRKWVFKEGLDKMKSDWVAIGTFILSCFVLIIPLFCLTFLKK